MAERDLTLNALAGLTRITPRTLSNPATNKLMKLAITELMRKGTAALGEFVARLSQTPALAPKVGDYAGRLSRLLGIVDIDLHVEEVTGADKSPDVVADIFNRVNSGGTKVSKGDLALAKICADWPKVRDTMKQALKGWAGSGYHFNLDWLLRSVNTVLTGEAKFSFLHEKSVEEVQDGLKRAAKRLDTCLNLIAGRLGLEHDDILFGRFGVPVMARYLDQRHIALDDEDVLLLQFLLQPFFESRQEPSRFLFIGRQHALDDNGITIGDT